MRSVTHFGLAAAITFSAAAFAQTPSSTPATPPATTPSSTQTAQAPATSADTQSTHPGATPAPADTSATAQTPADTSTDKTAAPANPAATKKQIKEAARQAKAQNQTDDLPSPGEALDPHIKPGSEDDVNAVGTRNIGGRGAGNWFSTDWEIRNGKAYSVEIFLEDGLLCVADVAGVGGDGDGGEQADDDHDDHELEEGEALIGGSGQGTIRTFRQAQGRLGGARLRSTAN